MKKKVSVGFLALVFTLTFTKAALSHCEIPCGIYGDTTRIDLLFENIATVEKSMKVITEMSAAKEKNANQLVRWISNKEEHANKIQEIASQYFLTQRIKPKLSSDKKAYAKYRDQIEALHKIIVFSMKCKQTTDLEHVKALRQQVIKLSELYFSKDDVKHIKEHHGSK